VAIELVSIISKQVSIMDNLKKKSKEKNYRFLEALKDLI